MGCPEQRDGGVPKTVGLHVSPQLSHINPTAIEHLEKRGLIDVTDATIASKMPYGELKECESEASCYGCGGGSSKFFDKGVHTCIEGSFHSDVPGMAYFQLVKNEAGRDEHRAGLTTRSATTDATAAYMLEITRQGVTIKRASGHDTTEPGWSLKVQRLLVDRGIKWRVTAGDPTM